MKKITTILAVVAIVATAGIGMGATLTYLSNPSMVSTEVQGPPINLELWDDGQWRPCEGTALDLGDIYGTDSVSWQFKATKLAHSEPDNTEVQLTGTLRTEMTCDGDLDGDIDEIDIAELDEVTIHFENFDGSHSEDLTWTRDGDGSNDDFEIVDEGKTLSVKYDTIMLYQQQGYKGKVTVTFNQYAVGDYEVTMQIL